jgi:uncharacterized membrane protein YkgB
MRFSETLEYIDLPLARFSIFIVYGWFGILKVIGQSPASPLVLELLEKTLPFISPSTFIILFGVYEVLIGILFLIPKLRYVAISLLIPHLIMTAGPIVLLPAIAWSGWFIPTLEGQYIIKNILIVALAIHILNQDKPNIQNKGQQHA